jgi:type VI secretion system protein ImpF
MAELSLEERLQPSLLDRLTDDEPQTKTEARSMRVLSVNRLKKSVLRDLAWLLNSGSLSITEDLSDYPDVESSVLNYGVSDTSGTYISSTDIGPIEKRIRKAITDFEPRIIADSLRVKIRADRQSMNLKALTFTIEGQLWAQPLPVSLYVSTEVDLETGSTVVTETNG